jgi:hypothetical protein
VTNWQVLHPLVNVFPAKTTIIHAIRLSGILTTGANGLLSADPHAKFVLSNPLLIPSRPTNKMQKP